MFHDRFVGQTALADAMHAADSQVPRILGLHNPAFNNAYHFFSPDKTVSANDFTVIGKWIFKRIIHFVFLSSVDDEPLIEKADPNAIILPPITFDDIPLYEIVQNGINRYFAIHSIAMTGARSAVVGNRFQDF